MPSNRDIWRAIDRDLTELERQDIERRGTQRPRSATAPDPDASELPVTTSISRYGKVELPKSHLTPQQEEKLAEKGRAVWQQYLMEMLPPWMRR